MTTAQIFFSFVAAALVLVGGVRMIRGNLDQTIKGAAVTYTGVCIAQINSGENPKDLVTHGMIFLVLCGFFYRISRGLSRLPKPGDEENDSLLGKQPSVFEVFWLSLRNK